MNKQDIKNLKVIQAPLAGISDIIYRKLIRNYGGKNTLLTTEMISCWPQTPLNGTRC